MTQTIKWTRSAGGTMYTSNCGRFVIHRQSERTRKYGAFFVIDKSRRDPVTPEYHPVSSGSLRSCKSQAERWIRGRN